MCYSKNLSIMSLSWGILGSILLINFSNKDNLNTNKAIGYFYIFVSLMQIIDYLLWSDINCENGYNKLGALLGPLLNHLQPIMILIIASTYLKSNNIISNELILLLNGSYLCYVMYEYYKYISKSENLCVKTNECNHLNWTWKKDFYYIIYFAISFINIINYYKNFNLVLSFIIGYSLLFLSMFNFHKNIGELWCLMATGVPFYMLFLQNVLRVI